MQSFKLAAVVLLLIPQAGSARDSNPNFYTGTTAQTSSQPVADPPVSTKPKRIVDKLSPTPSPKTKSADSSTSRATARNPDESQAKVKAKTPSTVKPPRKTPASKTAKATPISKKRETSASAAKLSSSKKTISSDPTPPLELLKYPLDPYGIAGIFGTRWDFNSFAVTAEEAARFRAAAIRMRTERLSNAFTRLSVAVEKRQRNIRSAAVATWLLRHARSTRPPFASAPRDTMHLAAAKTTLRADSQTLQHDLHLYEPLRSALNESIEEQKNKEDFLEHLTSPPDSASDYTITISNADLNTRATSELVSLRVPPFYALKAALEAEAIVVQQERRATLSSFAPPEPDPGPRFDPVIDPETPMPLEVGTASKYKPEQPIQSQPELQGTFVKTSVNAGVAAPADGTVAFAGNFRGYGNMIILQHGSDVFSIYSYLGNISVVERQPVKQGEVIGRAGTMHNQATGLHFQVRRGSTPADFSVVLGERPVTSLIAK